RKRSRIEYVVPGQLFVYRDDVLVDGYLEWRHFVVEDTLKMIDESLQHHESSVQKSLFESGMHYLHGYVCLYVVWFMVKLHMKDVKMLTEKKMYLAFWLESYARREPGIPLTVIFDMSEAGLSCVDMDLIKYIINCFQVYYPRFFCKYPFLLVGFQHRSSFLIFSQYPIKFSYPPLPDDVFQNPTPETGQEDDTESKDDDQEAKDTLVQISNHRPHTTFQGYEATVYTEAGEKRCLIMLSNVTKNQVAFKVRTTAPEKYRVKPSSSSCGAGESMEITVSLHGGFLCSPQDRFLIMAAEMEPRSGGGSTDLAQFWKGVPEAKIMEHSTGLLTMASSSRLEQKMDCCLWWQKLLTVLVTALTALGFSALYIQYTGEWPF
uniref:MSP domain-containing protein n=1 Tax=Oncorhynchus mykiss TaxID=8022 RepID=A0A8C7UWS3_ONCMY